MTQREQLEAQHEAKVLRELDHPNIIRYFDGLIDLITLTHVFALLSPPLLLLVDLEPHNVSSTVHNVSSTACLLCNTPLYNELATSIPLCSLASSALSWPMLRVETLTAIFSASAASGQHFMPATLIVDSVTPHCLSWDISLPSPHFPSHTSRPSYLVLSERFELGEVMGMFSQIILALKYLHSNRILHR